MYLRISLLVLLCSALFTAKAQFPAKAAFIEPKSGFWQNILKDDREVEARKEPDKPRKFFTADLTGLALPDKVDLYKNKQWHNPPISQGNTSTCWCFSTTSMLESDAYRINKVQVKLSEIYTVYWEWVEKTRRYIQQRGNSEYSEGSESDAVIRIWKKYGVVPEESYTGLLDGRKYHNHAAMVDEMTRYMQWVKQNAAWNEEEAIATIKSIMNHHIGVPPTEVNVDGKKMTPREYLQQVVKINPDDYVGVLSYMQEPFYKKVEYSVPDNWWHSKDYCNVPLDVFMASLKSAVHNGFTVAIGGDVSEPGFDRITQCAVVPEFDIPSAYINDDARQFRFSNKTTTDDHGLHIVGYLEKEGKDWYLVKDSGSGSRNGDPNAKEFGYYFFSEDYVKLKMMDFMVHKDGVKDLLEKFK